ELALEEGEGVGARDPHEVPGYPDRAQLLPQGSVVPVQVARLQAHPSILVRAADIRRAAGTAARRAAALLRHSRCSWAGALPATMPAPACTDARPSGAT